jgi:hypothetical protein
MSQHRPTMVSGSCKKDAVWNSSAVLARQDEVEIIGAGQAITTVMAPLKRVLWIQCWPA